MSKKTVKIEKGDWIAFHRDGSIVISEINYIGCHRVMSYRIEIHTNLGVVSPDSILEVRKRKE